MTVDMKKITSHYKSAIAGDLLKLKVDEWDMEIYFRKTYSFLEESKIINLQQKGDIVGALVESIIEKALDSAGKRLFADANRDTLLREADPAVIVKVAGAINNASTQLDGKNIAKE